MGLFDFLFPARRRIQILPDLVWISSHAKYQGLAEYLAHDVCQSSAVAVLLVAHFPDTLAELEPLVAGYDCPTPIMPVLAQELSSRTAESLHLDETATVILLIAERHPSYAEDLGLMDFAERLPCRCRIVHHVSLEDPLLRLFASEGVRQVLHVLGMSETQAIESSMVTRQIRKAQQQVDQRKVGDAPANSAAQWLEKNLPDGEFR